MKICNDFFWIGDKKHPLLGIKTSLLDKMKMGKVHTTDILGDSPGD